MALIASARPRIARFSWLLSLLALAACSSPEPAGAVAADPGGAAADAGALASNVAAAPISTTASWPAVDCVGGPCAAPNVCVNLDFVYVACVACGGEDQVCCPPYDAADPSAARGACDPGLVCGANPNFQSDPPKDLVKNVCQKPGSPPAADHGLNHQRERLTR